MGGRSFNITSGAFKDTLLCCTWTGVWREHELCGHAVGQGGQGEVALGGDELGHRHRGHVRGNLSEGEDQQQEHGTIRLPVVTSSWCPAIMGRGSDLTSTWFPRGSFVTNWFLRIEACPGAAWPRRELQVYRWNFHWGRNSIINDHVKYTKGYPINCSWK